MDYLDYKSLAPEGSRALMSLGRYIRESGLEPKLVDLLYLRISQINGCAYCVDLHGTDLRKQGESDRRITGTAAWREMPFYSERERAALDWTEALTKLGDHDRLAASRERLRALYSDKEVVDLTYAIGLMNALNRLGIGTGLRPAS